MDSISERIQQHITHVEQRKDAADRNEARTRSFLINPFLVNVLRYATDDPDQAVPEFDADPRGGAGEKVDYALMHEGEPIVLIEAKPKGIQLGPEARGQLRGYMLATVSARFGICTNGLHYDFYRLDGRSIENEPFFRVDLESPNVASNPEVVELLSMFVRGQFNPEQVEKWANDRKLREPIRLKIQEILTDPPDALVRMVMKEVDPNAGRGQVGRFKPIVAEVAREILGRAQPTVAAVPSAPIAPPPPAPGIALPSSATPQDEQIVSLREQGLSFAAIGERVGLPHYAVRNALIRLSRHTNTPRTQATAALASTERDVDATLSTQPDSGDIRIRWKHKGSEYHAVLQPDGFVRLQGDNTPRAPAGACKAAAGEGTIINGWRVWQYQDEQTGRWKSIGDHPNADAMKANTSRHRNRRS